MENNNVYIMSLEAAEIWEHMHRGNKIHKKYVGMLPFSLTLNQLERMKIKTFDSKRHNKTITNDIINVKFTQKVRSATEIIKSIDSKILGLTTKDEEYGEKLVAYRDIISKESSLEKWKEVKNHALRTELYIEGFTIDFGDGNKSIDYVVFSRSSAKSRTGQVLFIRRELRDKMIKWARLGMNLENRDDIDFPSLLSYESLVSSSIESTITINTKNILIVDDVKSIFSIDCNVVEKNSDGILISKPVSGYEMENDIFDGEGLLESAYFDMINKSDKGMILLRQHMFKCCAFNTNIQMFFRSYAESHNIDYNTWELKNMFNQSILAKEVHLIITPASLKALRFSHVKGSKPKMWKHWKKKLELEGCQFGICKSDKQSKRGTNADGCIVNQTSYQMLNSMQISKRDMEILSEFELNYIERLKNNDNTYLEYLKENANEMNCNGMLIDLYSKNNKVANTKLFKDKRKKDIFNYINHVKKGKIRLVGDYTTIIGNGAELLYHAIGRLPVDKNGVLDYKLWKDKMLLKDNEVYTILHAFDKEYVAFRNPHTSPSNVLIVKNIDNDFISTYFNLSKNIIYTNAINFPIQRILSGQDLDSDNLILFDNCTLKANARKCYVKSNESNYRVCVNGVKKDSTPYIVSQKDMAIIDNTLAMSQKNIGRVVNLGQQYMSTYWDMINNNVDDADKINKVLQAVDICTVLSEISIDSAKRMYDVIIKKQIEYLSKSNLLREKKPKFFKYVSQNEKIDEKIEKYDTAMDYLQDIIKVKDADQRKSVKLETLLSNYDTRKVKSRQINSIMNIIIEMTNEIKHIESHYNGSCDDDEEDKEKYRALNDIRNEYMQKIKHFKIRTETIYSIIVQVYANKMKNKWKIDVLNTLYKVDKKAFLQVFKG